MKKAYTMMAAAMAMGATAFAAPAVMSEPAVKNAEVVADLMDYVPVENTNGMMKAAPTDAELSGIYQWEFYGRTNQENGLQTFFVEIVIDGTTATLNSQWALPVKGTYNPSTMQMTFANATPLLTATEATSVGLSEQWKLFTREMVVENGQITAENVVNSISFQYFPQGAQFTDGSVRYVGGWLPIAGNAGKYQYMEFVYNTESNLSGTSGWVSSWQYGLGIRPLEEVFPGKEFKVNLADWSDFGEATLDGDWMSSMLRNPSAYDVPVMKHNTLEDNYLLVKPYGTGTPYAQMNLTPDAPGYIWIDASNKNCVLVRPLIPAGLHWVYSNLDIAGGWNCCNEEGSWNLFDDMAQDEIIEEFEAFDDPISICSDQGVITIPTGRVGMGGVRTSMFAMPYMGAPGLLTDNDDNEFPINCTITLKNWGAGVNGINSDNNTVKRYFNLQGIEIANPEAGEIVIVKDGSKTTKTVVR